MPCEFCERKFYGDKELLNHHKQNHSGQGRTPSRESLPLLFTTSPLLSLNLLLQNLSTTASRRRSDLLSLPRKDLQEFQRTVRPSIRQAPRLLGIRSPRRSKFVVSLLMALLISIVPSSSVRLRLTLSFFRCDPDILTFKEYRRGERRNRFYCPVCHVTNDLSLIVIRNHAQLCKSIKREAKIGPRDNSAVDLGGLIGGHPSDQSMDAGDDEETLPDRKARLPTLERDAEEQYVVGMLTSREEER